MTSPGLASYIGILLITTVSGQRINPPEEELILTSGATFELVCEYEQPVSWIYPNQDDVSSPKVEKKTKEGGKYQSILKMSKLHYMDTGFYSCLTKGANVDTSPAIYLFVSDPDNLFVPNIGFGLIQATEGDSEIIPCRPTSPDVNVTLWKDDQQMMGISWDPRYGFNLLELLVSSSGTLVCTATMGSLTQHSTYELVVHRKSKATEEVPKPIVKLVDSTMSHAVIGQDFSLECKVMVSTGTLVSLFWKTPYPSMDQHRMNSTTKTVKEEHNNINYDVHLSRLLVKKAVKQDTGPYTCTVLDASDNMANETYNLIVDSSHSTYLNLSIDGGTEITVRRGERRVQWIAHILSNPQAKVAWETPNGRKIMTDDKYTVITDGGKSKVAIEEVSIEDSGVYTLIATNNLEKKTLKLSLLVEDSPVVAVSVDNYYQVDESYKIRCNIVGYPVPKVDWFYNECSKYPDCNPRQIRLASEISEMPDGVHMESVITLKANQTRRLTCTASNFLGNHSNEAIFFVTDVHNGFALWGDTDVVTSDDVRLTCGASKYHYKDDISWTYRSEDGLHSTGLANASLPGLTIIESMSAYSFLSTIIISNISRDMTGYYICQSTYLYNVSFSQRNVRVVVKQLTLPSFTQLTNLNGGIMDVEPGEKVIFHCFVDGSPFPTIEWFQNGVSIIISENSSYVLKNKNQTLEVLSVTSSTAGKYSCIASNKAGRIKAEKTIQLFTAETVDLVALITGVVFFGIFCSVIVLFLCLRIRKDRKFRKELTSIGLYNFASGDPGLLNPNLDIYEQAENLPYNNDVWEFPRDKLKFSRQLGSGAFGVVVKAEAFGLNNSDKPTTVAVKMVKQNSNLLMVKNLASELKILAHLGKHLNIVNLIGACTGNIKNRELLVIVEYCKYGNLHNYLQKHRSLFINQINPGTGELEPLTRDQTLGLKNMDHEFQGHYNKSIASEYSNNSESKLIRSASTPTGYDGYLLSKDMDPSMSYYMGDYKSSSVKAICTQDLLCWAYQLANGMDYLGSRKVLHGDLAARNVLLAEDNIVKICDFGLAKDLYKNDNYLKRGHDLLPVKWLSIEALRDKIFSTQSDIWSYGVVLWEFFSLAMTPYPGMPYGEEFINKLTKGYRMEKPEYCPEPVYKLMLECWSVAPMERPTFAECSQRVEQLLQDSVREHYMGLSDNYLKLNGNKASQEDYLAMLNNPTFENMTTVSNSDYVTDHTYENLPRRTEEKAQQFELEPMLDRGKQIVTDC